MGSAGATTDGSGGSFTGSFTATGHENCAFFEERDGALLAELLADAHAEVFGLRPGEAKRANSGAKRVVWWFRRPTGAM